MRAHLIAVLFAGLGLAGAGCGGGAKTAVAQGQASATSGTASATPGPATPPAGPAASASALETAVPVAPAHPIPASFRASGISPGAPSDSEVRNQLKQMYAAQRQARTAAAANLAALLPWVDEPKTGQRVSIASVFVDYGLGLACGGLLDVNRIGVAHKTAPCGTLIDFTYNGRTLQVPVIDRGPYIVGREWDLTGATARALGFPGLGPIQWSCASC